MLDPLVRPYAPTIRRKVSANLGADAGDMVHSPGESAATYSGRLVISLGLATVGGRWLQPTPQILTSGFPMHTMLALWS